MDDITKLDEDDFTEHVESILPISLSYSRLSDFDRNGPSALIHRRVLTSFAMTYGSVVDELALPTDDVLFEDRFIISDFEKPTATSGKLVDAVLLNHSEMPTDRELLEICELSGF